MDASSVPAVEFEEQAIPPEVRLFQSVILCAWHDGFVRDDTYLRNTEGRGSDPTGVRQEARRWLTSDLEPWAGDRRTICDYANVDPTWLRDAARKRLALAKVDDAERESESQRRARDHIDALFAKLLARADAGLHPGLLDSQLRRLAQIEAETV